MDIGKTLFAQVMDCVPWKTFGRIIHRHGGDAGVCALDCADVFRVMAFSQLTWRESLRDIEVGAFYVMAQGYLDFGRLFKLHQAGACFVTQTKRGMNARRAYSNKSDRSTGVICDQPIRLNGFYVSQEYPEHLRRLRFKDPENGKTLVFLTNNTTLGALTIAALYKKRWQVELFFKWIKQHLCIKRFLGASENAVKRNFYPSTGKTQIGCVVSTYVLIAIIKKELQLNVPLYTILQILSVSIFEKTIISCALQPDTTETIAPPPYNQFILF